MNAATTREDTPFTAQESPGIAGTAIIWRIQERRRAADYLRVPSFVETPSRLAIMILGSIAAYLLLGIPGVMGWVPGAWAAMSASTPWDDIDPDDLSGRLTWAPIGEAREDCSEHS